jgi:hypothetical protein
MKRLVLAVLLSCTAGIRAEPVTQPVTGESLVRGALASPSARLSAARVVKGRFTHHKHLREIPKPLVANGEFIFARELGVYWHTLAPFDSVVVLTPSGILEKSEGTGSMRLSAEEQPAVRLIAQVFLALFTLDMNTLEKNFRLSSPGEATGRWTVILEPRDGAVARAFARAAVSGAADVEQVVLTDTQGDRTVIELAAIEYSGDPPSAATRALFAPPGP